jgi:hypothetical protein
MKRKHIDWKLEVRTRDRKNGGAWGPWEDLCRERFNAKEVHEFACDLCAQDMDDMGYQMEYRAVRLYCRYPNGSVWNLQPTPVVHEHEVDPPLAREMPAWVFAVNDAALSAMGV